MPFLIYAQTTAPGIAWEKNLGGSLYDQLNSIQQTKDSGYIVAGQTISNDFDVVGYQGNTDGWVVKLNPNGTIQWRKCFGGNSGETINSIKETFDGGYIFIGNKPTNGGDAWLVKIDSVGNIQWQKSFGGSSSDNFWIVEQTVDSGFAIAGGTWSNDGDITNNHGLSDGYVIKLDNTGNIQWSRSLGSSGSDVIYSLQPTNDGGFIVASNAGANDGDVSGQYHGSGDTWIVKLNLAGTIQWQNLYGGSNNDRPEYILSTNDGGYIFSSSTFSIDGDVTGNHGGTSGPLDIWVVKTDSLGVLQWQKCLGGSANDEAATINQTFDGGFVIAGYSDSNNGDVSGNHGYRDLWIAKINSTGIIQWQKSLGGSLNDDIDPIQAIMTVQQTFDGGFIIGGNTYSSNGDVNTHYGDLDMWVVKLLPDLANLIPVSNFKLADTSLCSGTCVNFTNQSTRDSSWQWLFPGGNPSSSNLQTPPQVCYNTPGTYSVTLITSNAFGSDTLTLTNYITVDPSPIAQINTNIATCQGTSINLTSSGGTSYAWSGPNGFTSNLQNPTITNSGVANSGTYSVIVSNSVGCLDTGSTQINISAVTPAVANSNSPLCAGQVLNLTSNNASSYSWSGPNGFTSSLQNPNIASATTNSSGTYTLIVTNSNGCADTTTLFISVLANNPVMVTSNGPLCTGQTLNLTASNGSSYSWTGPNGFTSTLQNPTINNVVVNNAGSYSVVVTNNNGCINSASLTLSINPNTPVTASSNSPICEGDNLTMNASAGSAYSWTGPNGFTSSIQNPTITNITTASSGLYSVTVTNACGTGSSNTQVQVGQKPNAAIAVTQTVICEGDTVYLTANGGNSYYWYGPNGFNSILSNPTVTNFSSANAGAYYLVATNTDNCSDTTVVNLALNESTCFFIPSVFTPNNDGTNDTWVIEGMWQFPNCVVKVYNRWGQPLFESKGYASPWDGTFEGNECPIADYYYIIDIKNGSKVFTGTVTIKR